MLCQCDKDIIRLQLDSQHPATATASTGKYNYNLRLPVKRNTYKKILLYIDNFQLQTDGLTNTSYVLNIVNLNEYNSYNSRTNGNNSVFVTLFSNAKASGRTSDFLLQYQGSTTPRHISAIPDTLNIEITNLLNVGIDLSDANNFWSLSLRLECFY